jgi:ABC-2 type transport system ATP-binding protein
MIHFAHVTRDYGDLKALQDISFSIDTGGIVGLLGPNGAGKTTTMRIMTGYLAATAGEITFAGEPFHPGRADLKRHIGYLPESAPLYGDMLAWDFLVWEARLHGVDPTVRVPEVIRMVGLDSHAHKPIRELSKGYRQRVGLAHTLIHDPQVLVLDEPTSGLDPNQIVEVRDLIRRIAQTKTVVLSTHIMQEVEALCDRVIVLHRGEIRYDGSIARFSAGAAGTGAAGTAAAVQRVRVFARGLSREEVDRRLRGIPAVEQVTPEEVPAEEDAHAVGFLVTGSAEELRQQIFHAAAGHDGGTPFELLELYRERTSLEQVFQELTHE